VKLEDDSILAEEKYLSTREIDLTLIPGF